MLLGCRIKSFTAHNSIKIGCYKDCLAKIICNPALPECFFGDCENFPGVNNLKKLFEDIFDLNII
jgi:hypothetical protein